MMGTSEVRLRISGMSCEHCLCRVESALMEAPGVRAVAVDLDTGSAIVTVDDGSAQADELVEAVRAAGYEASVVG